MEITGPHNYIVHSFKPNELEKAGRLARLISAGGSWDALVWSQTADSHDVVLPGQCVAGTEAYMRGFLECFLITEYLAAQGARV